MLLYVLFVCKYELYYCLEVLIQLQLTNIPYHIMTVANARRSVQVVQKSISHLNIRGSKWVKRGKLRSDSAQIFGTTVKNLVACDPF
jgi:hypothetical protein